MKLLRIPAPYAVLQKEFVARFSSWVSPVYLVNEYPKSGGTWLKFMLADALGLPPWTKGRPPWGSCVMQAHWLNAPTRCRTVVQFRDGRDVMVSFYYHSFFKNEFRNARLTELMRERFKFADYGDIRSNLLPFMRGIFSQPVSPDFTWKAFVHRWVNEPNVAICRYDDLRRDTETELQRLVSKLTPGALSRSDAEAIAERYSMENMRQNAAKLNPKMTGHQAAEKSFIRKGSVSGWSDSFTDEALAWFEQRHADELQQLGYKLGRPDAV